MRDERSVGGPGAPHLVMLGLVLGRLEQLLQDSDFLVGEVGAVRLHRRPEPARMERTGGEGTCGDTGGLLPPEG